jgi:hypothetical protein
MMSPENVHFAIMCLAGVLVLIIVLDLFIGYIQKDNEDE